MNLIIPVGEVQFYFYNEIESCSFLVGDNNYLRITVSPNIWMAFKGVGKSLNLVLNIASIPEDPHESINVDINKFSINKIFKE